MSTLWIGNFCFEDELESPKTLPRTLQRLEEELTPCLIAASQPGDFILTRTPWTPESWPELEAMGLADRTFVTIEELRDLRPSIERTQPWGWTQPAQELCKKYQLPAHSPSAQSVRVVNSRRTSRQLSIDLGCPLPGEIILESIADLTSALTSKLYENGFVIKTELGQSGRGQIRSETPGLTDSQVAWAKKRLQAGQRLFLEPRLTPILELGIQWDIPETGDPVIFAVTQLKSSPQGRYAQTIVHPNDLPEEPTTAVLSFQSQAVQRLQAEGYFGSVGIDAMIYQSPDNEIQIRPLQDINGRWTMGRLACFWAQHCFPNRKNVRWTHARETPTPSAIRTSPTRINEQPVDHATWCHE
ncbi:hypothetical protein KOR42_49700 [Thalassoglobus neptunius]|uniref:ATP-grasp domain-containing protein n=1 Tax=Thalassoglobus neptunius TaxID=1938619 RepID=A0A5C5VNL5_9PLAN|nr:hypothetical protein [Thalassoglobus neptunius]TWT40188.1 hypothetical protein KOR42_49700 [Thalassoglobus neptunius]